MYIMMINVYAKFENDTYSSFWEKCLHTKFSDADGDGDADADERVSTIALLFEKFQIVELKMSQGRVMVLVHCTLS